MSYFGETKERARKIIDALVTDDATRDICTWWPEKNQLKIYYEYTGNDNDGPSSLMWADVTREKDVAGSVYIWLDDEYGVWRMSGRYIIDNDVTETNVLTFATLLNSICNAFVVYPVPEYVRAAVSSAIARC